MSDYNQNDNGLNPISETFHQTNSSTAPKSEQRYGNLRDRVVARLGVEIPPVKIERKISPWLIPNNAPPEISKTNLRHQTMDFDLPPQGGSDDIPKEEFVCVTSLESNADPVGAHLVPSFDLEVVSDIDAMNLISLESGSEDDDKDKEYTKRKTKTKITTSRKRKSQVSIE